MIKLLNGDCLELMKDIPDECLDLIYIDPPYCCSTDKKFGNKYKKGIEHLTKEYIPWLNARLVEMKRLLKNTGSIFVHLDWHAAHYIKVEMDKMFGYDNFRNEIVWCYKSGGASKKNFSKKHDSILFYSKSKNYYFQSLKEKSYTKAKGRKAGIINYGAGNVEFFEDENGVYNLVNMSDTWDIPYINSQAKERIGYPTQKPEALLERIIKAVTKPGDVIADFFCGSGTTGVVAKKLYRKTDPSSSKEAAINNIEKIKTSKSFVFKQLEKYQGLTSAELASKIDGNNFYYWRNECSRRLADLANDNKVKRSDIRLCSISNKNCVTWTLNAEESVNGL